MARKLIGDPIDRIDGKDKVSGRAKYSGDIKLPGMLHGVLVMSTIASGRIRDIDTTLTMKTAGVVSIMSHLNAPKLQGLDKNKTAGPATNRQLQLFQDDIVYYNNQPVALVLADTLEHAIEGASMVKVSYKKHDHLPPMPANINTAITPKKLPREDDQVDTMRGDFEAGMESASNRYQQTFTTVQQTHVALEPHSVVAAWEGDKLTIYNATQGVSAYQQRISEIFGIPKENVRVICKYIGGGFGSKGTTFSPVVIGPMAARFAGRPVKLVLRREQTFGPVGSRAATEQSFTFGADASGKFTAVRHDTIGQTASYDEFAEFAGTITRMMYSCPNLDTTHKIVHANVGPTSPMRAPGEAPGVFALEAAVDEFASQLNKDPIQFRLINYAEMDEHKRLPFSTKSLRQCYEKGAQRFGWMKRNPQPRSMKNDRYLVGMGMATSIYPVNRAVANATVQLNANGTASLDIATQDLGTGTFTIFTQIVAEALGLKPEDVTINAGDSIYPEGSLSGGSRNTASSGSAVQEAANAVLKQARQLAYKDKKSPLFNVAEAEIEAANGGLQLHTNPSKNDSYQKLLKRNGGKPLKATEKSEPGAEKEINSFYAFGAVFAEVWVDEALGEVRVKRLHITLAAGRIINQKTARSQLLGGMVWATGMALQEHTVFDPRINRVMNPNLAEYHVPVNADIPAMEVEFLEEDDKVVNPAGVKGIGEMGVVGTTAAIVNAIYHATGKRIRDLPVTVDKLI